MLGEPVSRARSSADEPANQNAGWTASQASDQHATGSAAALLDGVAAIMG